MLKKYENYLQVLNKKLEEYFDNQKEYISCKAGCGICCKESYYPVSQLEYEFLKPAINELSTEQKELIIQNSIQIIKDRKIFLKSNPDIKKFVYICPLLFDDSCIVYSRRPMVCRSWGLLHRNAENPAAMSKCPYCVNYGLNYSIIWDSETKSLSSEKFKQMGLTKEPFSYDVSYSSLINMAKDINFGDIRMIVEWIIMDIPNYQEIIKDLTE